MTNPKKQSIYIHTKNRQAKEYTSEGQYINDKTPWTPEQLDELLDWFLVDRYPMLAGKGKPSLVYLCGRPVKAIQKALWRLGVRDPKRSNFWNYKPQSRIQRECAESDRDHFLISYAISDKGLEWSNAGFLHHIAQILCVEKDIVEKELERIYKIGTRKPSLRKVPKFDPRNRSHLKIIHKTLSILHSTKTHKEFTDEASDAPY